ncbi:MAG: DUF3795 domain-containing protein [Desulfobacteraceae bacterium]|jgi:hypothetical protein
MEEMIAYCGLACNDCPTYLATRADDDEKRAEVAKLWSKQFNVDFKPQDIHCDGCHPDSGRLFSYCMMCEIRKCGMEKEIANCAHCDEYSCEKLDNFLKMAPEGRKRLDKIRSNL